MREVHADLMGAASHRPGFDERSTGVLRKRLEVCLGGFAARIDLHALGRTGLLADALPADPLALWRVAVDHGEVHLFHVARFEQLAVGANCARRFPEEQHARGLGVQAVDIAQELETARTRPAVSSGYGAGVRGLTVALRALPGHRDKHPHGWFIDRNDGAIFVEDGNALAVPEFHVRGFHFSASWRAGAVEDASGFVA